MQQSRHQTRGDLTRNLPASRVIVIHSLGTTLVRVGELYLGILERRWQCYHDSQGRYITANNIPRKYVFLSRSLQMRTILVIGALRGSVQNVQAQLQGSLHQGT